MRFLLVLAVVAETWAQTNDALAPESTSLLEQIKRRAIEDLASVPNYVCVDSIERSLWIRSFGYLEDHAVVKYDPPGTATVYVSQEKPVFGRDVIIQWVTISESGLR